MKILLMAALLTISLHAQTAKVIQLTPEDAARAKSIAEEKAAMAKKESEFQKHIQAKYLAVDDKDSHSNCLNDMGHVKSGWGCGDFEYSDDFKFIVPKPSPPSNCGFGCGLNIVPGGMFTTTPATIPAWVIAN